MTPYQFWDDDYTLVVAYREAWEIKRKEKNRWLWLQGLYIYKAFNVVMANAFKKSGSPSESYLKEPIALSKAEIDERKERDERKAYEQAIAETKAWMEAHNGTKKEVNTDV